MKRNWEKDLHDRLGSHEQDAPDGLWEEISRQMADVKQRPQRDRKPTLFLTLPMRRAVSVAAAACLALVVGYHFYGNDTDGTGNTGYTAEMAETTKTTETAKTAVAPSSSAPSPKQHSAPSSATKETPGKPLETAPQREETTPASPSATPEEDHHQQQELQQKQQQKPVRETDRRHLMADAESHRRHRRPNALDSRWVLGTAATAGMGSSQTVSSHGMPIVAAGSDAANWMGDPEMGFYVYNQGRETKTEYTHHLPVHFGLNVAYRLTDRLSIESGLSYTQLSSDMKDGTEKNYSTGSQELNYVGVPVNLKYRVLTYRRLRLYASAGLLAEQCVSGKVTKDIVLNGTSTKTEESDVSSKPLQLSANAAVGVQFDLSGSVGIYAEPGLSYYFDDRSSLSTIYKEKPLNLNLNVGLRFTLGK